MLTYAMQQCSTGILITFITFRRTLDFFPEVFFQSRVRVCPVATDSILAMTYYKTTPTLTTTATTTTALQHATLDIPERLVQREVRDVRVVRHEQSGATEIPDHVPEGGHGDRHAVVSARATP